MCARPSLTWAVNGECVGDNREPQTASALSCLFVIGQHQLMILAEFPEIPAAYRCAIPEDINVPIRHIFGTLSDKVSVLPR